MSLIQNPILPGFNADPSIIRVEDTYYIANSTFEWFPGVRLHNQKIQNIGAYFQVHCRQPLCWI